MEVDGSELAEIAHLAVTEQVKPHVAKTYAFEQASEAPTEVEQAHSVGKIVLVVKSQLRGVRCAPRVYGFGDQYELSAVYVRLSALISHRV